MNRTQRVIALLLVLVPTISYSGKKNKKKGSAVVAQQVGAVTVAAAQSAPILPFKQEQPTLYLPFWHGIKDDIEKGILVGGCAAQLYALYEYRNENVDIHLLANMITDTGSAAAVGGTVFFTGSTVFRLANCINRRLSQMGEKIHYAFAFATLCSTGILAGDALERQRKKLVTH